LYARFLADERALARLRRVVKRDRQTVCRDFDVLGKNTA